MVKWLTVQLQIPASAFGKVFEKRMPPPNSADQNVGLYLSQ
jgi:hypothetical protein